MDLKIQVSPKRVLQHLKIVLEREDCWRHGTTQELTAFDERIPERTLLEALQKAVGQARNNLGLILKAEELHPVDDLKGEDVTLYKEAGQILAKAALHYCDTGYVERFQIKWMGLFRWSDIIDYFNAQSETTHRDVVAVIDSALRSLEGKKFVTRQKVSKVLPHAQGIVQA